ncbi:hypothetical protein K9M06_02915 [Candidatus Bipolaricaulota bacterium]|nr:hypothetical protein [Candidatus Bipolaricaulota bacterium]
MASEVLEPLFGYFYCLLLPVRFDQPLDVLEAELTLFLVVTFEEFFQLFLLV